MSVAMICGGTITIKDWPKSTTQPGDQLRKIFSDMGAKIEFDEQGLSITGGNEIRGIDIDLHEFDEDSMDTSDAGRPDRAGFDNYDKKLLAKKFFELSNQ